MRRLPVLIPAIAALLVVLTYFVLQGALPDPARHEQTLNALRTVNLDNAALQRDVLRARTGLLRSYDPLVQAVRSMRQASEDLQGAGTVARGDRRTGIDRRVQAVAAAVREEEALLEMFKSNNALLQNSLSYFNYLIGRLGARNDVAAELGVLAMAMFRFVGNPEPDAAKSVTASLDRLSRLAAGSAATNDLGSLVAHAQLIVATLPQVDGLVSRLQASPTGERLRALQDAYLDAHGRAASRAAAFQAALYVAALILVAYAALLFIRLGVNARNLRERLDFESLIASISTQFINLPRERMGADIGQGLARIVERFGLDTGRIIISAARASDPPEGYFYTRGAASRPAISARQVHELAETWSLEGYERQGCIHVSDAGALPAGPEKNVLQAHEIRSWLCIPMWIAGERLGFLTLDAATRRNWTENDIALLRTTAEIFASAIARERGESERDALQASLAHARRLEAIGTLAGGIAHEFNNVLGAMSGYAEMAHAALLKGSRARRHVEQIMKAGDRAQGVIDRVLAFGRRRERQPRSVQAASVVAEAVELVRASLPATLSVETHIETGNASLLGDSTEIQQVVINLARNAAQAMENRGTIEISLDTVESGENLSFSHASLPAGRYIRLSVIDTGCGMDRTTMERIFEPFFTTKPAGQGTGLGLSTIHGIVADRHGGVNVKSRVGRGTTFEVYFPRIAEAAAEEDSTATIPTRRGRGETVMVVDNDKPLVALAEEMLASLGYEPVGFEKARMALAAFRRDPQRFDLVLTDEIMPGMTGTQLAGELHQIRPDIPIILMTGSDRPPRPQRLKAAGIREVLRKPLLTGALSQCLARLLS